MGCSMLTDLLYTLASVASRGCKRLKLLQALDEIHHNFRLKSHKIEIRALDGQC